MMGGGSSSKKNKSVDHENSKPNGDVHDAASPRASPAETKNSEENTSEKTKSQTQEVSSSKEPPESTLSLAMRRRSKVMLEIANETQKLALMPTCEFEALPMDQEHDAMVMVTLKSPHISPGSLKRSFGVDVVAIIDRSGSMHDGKLVLVQETLDFMTSQLQEQDRLALVSFSDSISTDLPLTYMDTDGHNIAANAVEGLKPRGTTNLSGGLLRGIELLVDEPVKNDLAAILLFTDGMANKGLLESKEITSAMKEQLSRLPDQDLVTVFTFGYGTMHDPDMLDNIASAASGMYYRIIDPEVIPAAFTDCLGGILSVVARGIQVEVSPGRGVEVMNVLSKFPTITGKLPELDAQALNMMRRPSLKSDSNSFRERVRRNSIQEEKGTEEEEGNNNPENGYENRGIEGDIVKLTPTRKPFRVEFRDLYSEEERDLPFHIHLDDVSSNPEYKPDNVTLLIRMQYYNTLSSEVETTSCDLIIKRPRARNLSPNPSRNFLPMLQRNRFVTADAMQKASALGQRGTFKEAREVISNAVKRIKDSGVPEQDSEALVRDLEHCVLGLLDQHTFAENGLATLRSTATAHFTQRSNSVVKGYTTQTKNSMLDTFNTMRGVSKRRQQYEDAVRTLRGGNLAGQIDGNQGDMTNSNLKVMRGPTKRNRARHRRSLQEGNLLETIDKKFDWDSLDSFETPRRAALFADLTFSSDAGDEGDDSREEETFNVTKADPMATFRGPSKRERRRHSMPTDFDT